ncbi:MAG: tetratricopeptide repeat protein, partial [Pseudomonadota bacterium]
MLIAACGGESADDHLATASQLEQAGDYAGALQSLKGALRKDPDNAQTRALFSQMYLLLGKPADARTQLDRAIKLGINESAVVLLDIDIALAEGDAELALAKIDALKLADRSAKSELRQAQAHLLLGQSD